MLRRPFNFIHQPLTDVEENYQKKRATKSYATVITGSAEAQPAEGDGAAQVAQLNTTEIQAKPVPTFPVALLLLQRPPTRSLAKLEATLSPVLRKTRVETFYVP